MSTYRILHRILQSRVFVWDYLAPSEQISACSHSPWLVLASPRQRIRSREETNLMLAKEIIYQRCSAIQ